MDALSPDKKERSKITHNDMVDALAHFSLSDNQKSEQCPPSVSMHDQNLQEKGNTRKRYRGVKPSKGDRFGARITREGKQLWIGTYDTEEEAARAYDEKAREFYPGKEGKLNFPDQDSTGPLSSFSGTDHQAQPRDYIYQGVDNIGPFINHENTGLMTGSGGYIVPSSDDPQQIAPQEPNYQEFYTSSSNAYQDREQQYIFQQSEPFGLVDYQYYNNIDDNDK